MGSGIRSRLRAPVARASVVSTLRDALKTPPPASPRHADGRQRDWRRG